MDAVGIYVAAANNPVGNKQRGLFKRTRAEEELTREQVKAIKKGRKALREDLRQRGITDKKEFELMASSLGLYFDKSRWLLFLLWLFGGRGLWLLAAALGLLLFVLWLFSQVTQMRGHFTINMTDDLFREGFVLSETVGFERPTTHLFCTPAEDVPCVSISFLPDDLDAIDGKHHDQYFAYTFYCKNAGETVVGYDWTVRLNSESKDLSSAAWVMIFEDGEMTFYAEPNAQTGEPEALPAFGDDSRGYIGRPLEQFCKAPEAQYETILEKENFSYNRVIPQPFVSEDIVAAGRQPELAPGDYHKYTVVVWLEGDDPDCTNDKIGGHLGMDFEFSMIKKETA